MIQAAHQSGIETSSAGYQAASGDSRICLSVAGLSVALNSGVDDLRLKVEGAMCRFVAEETMRPDVNISVAWGQLDELCDDGDLLFDSGGIWRLYSQPEGFLIRLAAPFSGWRPYKIARFNTDWTRGEILCQREYFAQEQAIYPLEYPLDELIFTNLLATGKGIEIHACGLLDSDGSGYLFPGQSGAGKSTTARLWQSQSGVEILSDERIILRRVGQQIFMYGTPWHGDAKLAQSAQAPLKRIFFPGRGPQHELISLGKAEAAARLFACSFPPFYSPEGIAFTLQFLDEVVQTTACDELKFVPDETVVQFIRTQSGGPHGR